MRVRRSSRPSKTAAQRIKQLRGRVQELEETFQAIDTGRVDAVVVNRATGDQVFTLSGAEHPYRVLVETMNEGAGTLDRDGTILYANASFARILGMPLQDVVGTRLQNHFIHQEREKLQALIN